MIFVDLSTYGPHRKWVMKCFMSYQNVPILGVDSSKKHGRLNHGESGGNKMHLVILSS